MHLYRTFEGHDVVALQGVDLDIAAGERVAFLGPSGSGKSTLLTLFGGIQRPSAGKIFLGTHEISRMTERDLTKVRAQRVSTMLQGATRNLLPYATARENLAFARVGRRPHAGARCSTTATCSTASGSPTRPTRWSRRMSGGEQQRLALACAVTSSPQLLLADEPTSQLNHEDRDHMLELIHRLGDDLGTTILVVTHQPEVAATFPRTITMKGGRVGAEGRHGAEYVVIGTDGVLHLPAELAATWPPGTLVRIEPEDIDTLIVSRPDGARTARERAVSGPIVAATRSALSIRGRADPAPDDDRVPAGRGHRGVAVRPARARRRCCRSSAGWSGPPRASVSYDGGPTWQGDGDPHPEVAYILQVYGLVPILTARENVAVALRARGADVATLDERADRRARALPHRRPRRPPGRGAVGRPDAAGRVCARVRRRAPILLADEPTSELDEGNRAHVMAELHAEAGRGAVVVVATHDSAVVDAADRHVVIDEGRLDGPGGARCRHRAPGPAW